MGWMVASSILEMHRASHPPDASSSSSQHFVGSARASTGALDLVVLRTRRAGEVAHAEYVAAGDIDVAAVAGGDAGYLRFR